MRNVLKFMSVALIMIAIACGSDLVAPKACQSFPSISLYVGESETITPCFTDESGAPLSYSVESTNPDIADGIVRGSRVVVSAISPGEVTITVTADNGDATGEITFAVAVPNREPEIIEEPEAIQLSEGRKTTRVLSDIFTEPDRQALSYSATTTAPGVVLAHVSEDTLTVEGVGRGEAQIVVTASDGSTSASVDIDVTILAQEVIFADGFSDESGNWLRSNSPLTDGPDTGLEIRGGKLAVWSLQESARGAAVRAVAVGDWEVNTRMRAGANSTHAVLGVLVDSDYRYVELDIGTAPLAHIDADFNISVLNPDLGYWTTLLEGEFGLESYEDYVDIRFWYRDGQYHVSFNGGETMSMGDTETTGGKARLIAFVSDHWVYESQPGRKVYMDSISVSGYALPSEDIISGPIFFRDRRER